MKLPFRLFQKRKNLVSAVATLAATGLIGMAVVSSSTAAFTSFDDSEWAKWQISSSATPSSDSTGGTSTPTDSPTSSPADPATPGAGYNNGCTVSTFSGGVGTLHPVDTYNAGTGFGLTETGDLWIWGDQSNGQSANSSDNDGNANYAGNTARGWCLGGSFTKVVSGVRNAETPGLVYNIDCAQAGSNIVATSLNRYAVKDPTGSANSGLTNCGTDSSHALVPGALPAIAGLNTDGNVYTWAGGMTNGSWLADPSKRLGWSFDSSTPNVNMDYSKEASYAAYGSKNSLTFGGTKIVDIASMGLVFIALDAAGDVWTWGIDQGNYALQADNTTNTSVANYSYGDNPSLTTHSTSTTGMLGGPSGGGQTGQGVDHSSQLAPVKILSGVHSIGAGVWNGWAVKSDGVYFWGANDPLYGGYASGTTTMSASINTPTKITSGPIYDAFAAGQAAGDNNSTLGVAAPSSSTAIINGKGGSTSVNGTFCQMTGNQTGVLFRQCDGKLLYWGPKFTSTSAYGSTLADAAATTVGTGGIVQVATTNDLMFAVDSGGNVYEWGIYRHGWEYADVGDDVSATAPITSKLKFGLAYNYDDGQYSTRAGGTSDPELVTNTNWSGVSEIGGYGNTLSMLKTNSTFWSVGGSIYAGRGSGASGNVYKGNQSVANNNPYGLVRVTFEGRYVDWGYVSYDFGTLTTNSSAVRTQALTQMYLNPSCLNTESYPVDYCDSNFSQGTNRYPPWYYSNPVDGTVQVYTP